MAYKFKPKKLRGSNITIWLDGKELARLRAVLLYHKFCGYDSINTEAFFDGLIRPRCYVPSMYKRAKKRAENETASLKRDGGRKLKKVWGIFYGRADAVKYFLLGCIQGYFNWTEIVTRKRSDLNYRNPRWIYLTNYGKIKQKDFLEELSSFSFEDLNSEANYPLFVIKKSFVLGE